MTACMQFPRALFTRLLLVIPLPQHVHTPTIVCIQRLTLDKPPKIYPRFILNRSDPSNPSITTSEFNPLWYQWPLQGVTLAGVGHMIRQRPEKLSWSKPGAARYTVDPLTAWSDSKVCRWSDHTSQYVCSFLLDRLSHSSVAGRSLSLTCTVRGWSDGRAHAVKVDNVLLRWLADC